MKIYLAGPMTGLKDFNHPAFHHLAEQWRDRGYTVFNPAETFDGDTTRPRADYLREEIKSLLQADGIALMPGWRESLGARHELLTAQLLELPAFHAQYHVSIKPPPVRTILGDAK
jgi:hypothetical protein